MYLSRSPVRVSSPSLQDASSLLLATLAALSSIGASNALAVDFTRDLARAAMASQAINASASDGSSNVTAVNGVRTAVLTVLSRLLDLDQDHHVTQVSQALWACMLLDGMSKPLVCSGCHQALVHAKLGS